MKKERYPMCEDQPAQIDCRKSDCIWHKEASCTNVSPAITLNPNKNFVCWSEEEKKPIFKLNNKFMYEGDEYWVVDFVKWRLQKLITRTENFPSALEYDESLCKRFLTKQEALNYVLAEAKKRFEWNEYFRYIGESKRLTLNHFNYRGLIISENNSITNGTWQLWHERKGWLCEPVKEHKLMLGDEVVEIEKTLLNKEDVVNADEHVLIPRIWDVEVHCKGESVTKEEWMEWQKVFVPAYKKDAELLMFQLGKFDTECYNGEESFVIGCIDNATIEQIEAITKQLESC
jgi:hypothetical protein